MTEPLQYEVDLIADGELTKAADWLETAAEAPEGALCPCCGKFDKVYTRKITRQMVKKLCRLARLHHENPSTPVFHYSRFARISGDFAKFIHVGAVTRMPNDDETKKSSGYYSITPLGVQFVTNEKPIPAGVILHRGEVVGVSSATVKISDLFPDFDYRDLFKPGGATL